MPANFVRTARDADAVEQQRALAAHELGGVDGERLELGAEPGTRLEHRRGDGLGGLRGAVARPTFSPMQTVSPSTRTLVPSLIAREDLGADVVDQQDAARDQHLRAEVRIAAGDARLGVDHHGRPGRGERLGGHPVQVDVVDDRDVAGVQPAGEAGGAAVQARDAADARKDLGPAAQGRELHVLGVPAQTRSVLCEALSCGAFMPTHAAIERGLPPGSLQATRWSRPGRLAGFAGRVGARRPAARRRARARCPRTCRPACARARRPGRRPSTMRTSLAVTPPLGLATTMCRSANAATWARWVTASTW